MPLMSLTSLSLQAPSAATRGITITPTPAASKGVVGKVRKLV